MNDSIDINDENIEITEVEKIEQFVPLPPIGGGREQLDSIIDIEDEEDQFDDKSPAFIKRREKEMLIVQDEADDLSDIEEEV